MKATDTKIARECPRGLLALGLLAALLLAGRRPPAAAAQAAPVILVPGWNNIGYSGPAEPVAAALATLAGQYDALWRFDGGAQQWLGYNPMMPERSDFTEFSQGSAYWIHMTQAAVLPIGSAGTGPAPAGGFSLGWNNFVQQGPTAAVGDALAALNTVYSVIWHWNAGSQKWEMFQPASTAVNDFQQLVRGQAYFMLVTQLTAPAPISAAGSGCYPFTAYQPQYGEVADALTRAGNNTISSDPAFRLGDAYTSPAGGAQATPGYVPPSVLKAVSWLESSWRQAAPSVDRGSRGPTIVSSQCAYGVLQVLTGMQVSGTPTARQNQIGSDYLYNAAAGAELMLGSWNMAPDMLPVYGRRDPHVIEDWYFAIWSYYCYGDACARYGVHNNPDDPAFKWPRPMYASPEEQNPASPFTRADYPYQELVFGRIAFPPTVNGAQLWQAVPVVLPPHGTVGFPVARNTIEASAHLEGGQALPVPAPIAVPTGTPAPAASPGAGGH